MEERPYPTPSGNCFYHGGESFRQAGRFDMQRSPSGSGASYDFTARAAQPSRRNQTRSKTQPPPRLSRDDQPQVGSFRSGASRFTDHAALPRSTSNSVRDENFTAHVT